MKPYQLFTIHFLSPQISIKNKTLIDMIYFWNLLDLYQDMYNS